MTASTTEQERAAFEAWYIAGARKSVPAFAEWSEIELREGCMRPDSGSYRIDYARIAWDAWQAARRAPAAPVPQVTPEMIDAAEEAYMPFGDMELAIQCALSAAPQPPEAAQSNSAEFDGIKTKAAPVQMPEPAVPYAIFDCHGFYETRTTKGAAQSFCDHYNKRDADGGGSAPYTVQALYTEQQVRQLLAAHGIKEQST